MVSRVLEMYATGKGVVAVRNPVKIRILHAAVGEGASFESIVSLAGRSKATVSVHLGDLKAQGLVAEREVDGDHRKKVFYRTARLLGVAKPPEDAARAFVRSEIGGAIGDPFAFMSSLFRTVRYSLESMGFDTDAAIRAAGQDVGAEVAKTFSSTDLGGLERELSVFWGRHRLGKMSFPKPLVVRVRGCVSTKNSPCTGKTECALSEGIIESIFRARLGKECSVKELKCRGTGHPYCEFAVAFRD